MAVILGTNAGFVTVAPTSDPDGLSNDIDQSARVTKDTCPANVGIITEIGFWVDNSHAAHDYDVGLYSHDSGSDTADALLFSSTGYTTTGSAGWHVVSGLDWSVTPGTIYWVGVLLGGGGSPDPEGDFAVTGGRTGIRTSVGSFPDPFSTQSDTENVRAFYAVVDTTGYEEGTKTVTVAATVSLSTDLTVRVEGTKTVTVAVTVSLASENYVSQSGFPTDRPSDYDGDKYWDKDARAWGSTRTTIPGNWTQNVLAISEEGEIYFRTV